MHPETMAAAAAASISNARTFQGVSSATKISAHAAARAASENNSPAPRPLLFEVDVSFVTDAEIAALNAQYRRKNRPTDVLSFAQSEGEEFPLAPAARRADGETREPPEPPVFALGDIVISVETAQRQARERGHDIITEVAFLATHGALHLLGYDHATSAQRRAMWKHQEKIFADVTSG
jgi:probable rRNA maturation factor